MSLRLTEEGVLVRDELIYNHYVKVKGIKAPYSQEFAEKMRPEGGGHRGTAEADDLGFGTLMYTRE